MVGTADVGTGARARRLGFIGLLVAAAALLFAAGADAGPSRLTPTCTKTWTGTTSTAWTNLNNWSPTGVPGAADYVCITNATANQPTLSVVTSVAGVAITSGQTLTISGTLNLTDSTGTKSSELTTATVTGNGVLAIATGHVFNWTSGYMISTGAGSTTVAAGATLNIAVDTSNYAYLDVRTLTNNGTINYTPGATGYGLYIGGVTCGTTTLTNNGTFTYNGLAASDPGIIACGVAKILNSGTGTFTKTGAGSALVTAQFENDGAASVQAGLVSFNNGNGAGTSVGTYGATGGATLEFLANTFNFSGTPSFTGGVRIAGGTVDVNSGTLTLTGTNSFTGGDLTGSGNVVIDGTLTWAQGAMTGSGSTTVNATRTVNATNGGTSYQIVDRPFTNNGTFTYTPHASGYGLYFGGNTCTPAAFTNTGTFTYVGLNASDPGIADCGLGQITNSGTFTKTAGTSSATVSPQFENDGTTSSGAGVLNFNGGGGPGTSTGSWSGTALQFGTGGQVQFSNGTYKLAGNPTFTGVTVSGGIVDVTSGGLSFVGGVTVSGGEVEIDSGALTITGANTQSGGIIDTVGTVSIGGTYTWSAGVLMGTGAATVPAGATLNAITGGSNYQILDRSLTNNGTVNYTPHSSGFGLYLGGQTCGTTTLTNAASFNYLGLGVGSDPGIYGCGVASIVNTGTFTRTAGAGTASILPLFENDGTVAVQVGTIHLQGGTGVSGGTFGATGGGSVLLGGIGYHVAGTPSFTGGVTVGAGTIVDINSGTLSLSGANALTGTITGAGALNIGGTLAWNGGGATGGTGATTIQAGATVNAVVGAGSYIYIDTRPTTNNGNFAFTPNVSGFTLYLGGLTCTPTTFTNNATLTYSGLNASDPGIIECGGSKIDNNATGTITKTGNGQAIVQPEVDNDGTITVSDGNLTVSGAFPAYVNATSTLSKGTYNLTGILRLPASAGNVVRNAASITLTGAGSALQNSGGTSALGTLNTNQATGSLTVTGGKSLAVSPLTNSGTVTVNASSTLSMAGGAYTQTTGTTTVNGNLTSTGGGAAININGGTIQGTGTLTPATSNGGTLRPGTSPGILTVSGNYTQSLPGSLNIEINGTTPGTGHDQLVVSGAASLNGTLNLTTTGFTPTVGQTFTIATFASRTGCFTTYTGRDLSIVGQGMFYDVACNATNVVVTVKRAQLSINDVSITEGNAGTTNLTFTVSLNQSRPDATINVSWATAPGSATSPADFTAASGSVGWSPNDGAAKTFNVAIVGDLLDEANETFNVNLTLPAFAFISDSQGVGTINDNDPPPSISIDNITQNELNAGTSTFDFTISLNAASGQAVSVNWATADALATAPSDYTAANGTASFTAGVTTQTVSITVNGDPTIETNETFEVNLAVPVNATISDAQGIGTITNDDALPAITSFNPAAATAGKTISILGSGFTGTTQITFTKAGGGTVVAPTYTVVNDGEISVKVPKNSITGTVTVTTPSGTGNSPDTFKVIPKVKSFTPISGPVGTLVTVNGTSFTGTFKVQLNGQNTVFTVVNDKQLTFTVPAGATSGKIEVSTPGGKGKSKTNFAVTP